MLQSLSTAVSLYQYYIILNARTAGGNDIHALDDPDNTLYVPVHTPVTSPGHAISDMDRDIKKGVACKEDLHNPGATRSWDGSV